VASTLDCLCSDGGAGSRRTSAIRRTATTMMAPSRDTPITVSKTTPATRPAPAPHRLITFRVSRRPREMYCGHARLCVCLSAAACLQYCTDPDVTWGSGRGCPLVVHYWADLQSVHGLRRYGNIMEMCGRASTAVIRQAQRTPHARTSDKIDAPAACATLSGTRPFHFVHTARVLQREREMLASTCLYSLYA